MKLSLRFLLFAFSSAALISTIASCRHSGVDEATYRSDLEKWHAERVQRLKSKNGWLNLAGLLWLKAGTNTFGSDSANTLVFPPAAPAFMGVIILTGDSLTLTENKADILVDSQLVTHGALKADTTGTPSVMTWGHFSWHIIKRGNRFAIRLRDFESSLLAQVNEVPYYPIDSRWRVTAKYTPYDEPRKQVVQTVIGTDAVNPIPGELTFKLGGKTLKLYPVLEDGGFTLMFGDPTNGDETYGGGRFLDIDAPDARNHVIIDFNKAYNPPCCFTPFATCQLPHRDNMLPVKIEAGEKAMHLVPGH
jgi:uncharacterized protein